ncbi:uncharacterized protein LOC125804771 [Astyanax mexicanus]|uniref:uncharacterized protein LOC125804771 n=1 Tax=Astyanax mexicanus TaxID=7994 RepID=UPI0020CB1077|nr:uncharacterized protein LOC125804771 [Astyanax mexicanus]
MAFSLEKFVMSPSVEALETCRKADLLCVGEFYKVSLPRSARKAEIRDVLISKLCEIQRLPVSPDTGTPAMVEAAVSSGVSGAGVALSELGASSVAEAAEHSPGTQKGIDPVVTLPVEGLLTDLSMAIRLKELDLAIKKQECETQHLRVRALELEANSRNSSSGIPTTRSAEFDISKHISLVPPFRESEVDSYFTAFERVASTLHWPKDMWPLLLQCKLVGKAQEVCSSLTVEQSLEYDTIKASVLRAYELVPEAYRQRYRSHQKSRDQTFVEFAREKTALFEKWCSASKVATFAQLKELILLEDFKNSVPEVIVVHLNEKKVAKLSEAAVLTDEFVLTHKMVFPAVTASSHVVSSKDKRSQGGWSHTARTFERSPRRERSPPKPSGESSFTSEKRVCFYCRRPGHLIADCTAWNRKKDKPKSVACLSATSASDPETVQRQDKYDSTFQPFILDGHISLSKTDECCVPVKILRDTGAAQSFISSDVLEFGEQTFCGSSVVVCGIELIPVSVPLHCIHLNSDLVSGMVRIAVRTKLPVEGVDVILGNDLAGGKVFPVPEVVADPTLNELDELQKEFPSVFPVCATTRSQSSKEEEVIDIGNFFTSVQSKEESSTSPLDASECKLTQVSDGCFELSLPVDRAELVSAQEADPSLAKCRSAVVDSAQIPANPVAFYLHGSVLMRKWAPSTESKDWNSVYQVVVPEQYRAFVLNLAHDHVMAGHLGINKTYTRILQHFFWPGLKADVVKYCNSCHVCQVAGKPNQSIPPAPLCPVPAVGEPFEHLLLDCVGPLPKTKSGNQYLLTIMCLSTRFPDAFPLRTITAKSVSRALVRFCSVFGLPKTIQTDKGTNFTAKLFAQVLHQLNVEHKTSSAFHPESQGALERFHQTLKTQLRIFCLETGKDWDEGLPLLMFALREVVQESTGFSPAQLVFAHTVRGPLKLLKDQLLGEKGALQSNLLDFVGKFRERLHKACEVAQRSLLSAQSSMKEHFDKQAVHREFKPHDQVLILLPVSGSALHTKFSGPYEVVKKLSEVNYVVSTPDRKRRHRVCHINMLKPYLVREDSPSASIKPALVSVVSEPESVTNVDDELMQSSVSVLSAHLQNSELLPTIDSHLQHLPEDARADLKMELS